MISQRSLFLQHVAQTSEAPLMLEIEKAEGIYMYGTDGKKYIDLISGISVSNIGHCNPKVVEAIKQQVDKHMHLMVYGEYIQKPQVDFASKLTSLLPDSLNSVYFVNSGSEAIEGAMKLAKRSTGRTEIISCKKAYHGSTHGALSIMGDESFKNAYRPLIPEIKHIEYNNFNDINEITDKTACIVIEPVQAEGGVILPEPGYLEEIRKRCTETGTLLIFDEVQTGFGRLGSLFGFLKYNIIPDVFVIAKGMGGGMPIGAFVSSKELMSNFMTNPILGHITTFGGHPVSCAAAYANLNVLLEEKLIEGVEEKGKLFREYLKHDQIKEIRGEGLILAFQLKDFDQVQKVINYSLDKGVVFDWFLFNDSSFRIAPPLIITPDQIKYACNIILEALDQLN